ncbi:alpha/beta-gliadin A-III [Gossypium australe]|uniref:Alpha/beta-gliadin A-III n=1 Tax=Gossypium australe TaxID=47621 RepID=A0A5B6WB15_9ROSI|nr:alpha/beta-gliadin A-III [Gossypium australe]
MVSDQEIARGVENLLRQSDPSVATTLNGVVQQLEAKLGLDLSHKAGFIRDQINLLLRPPQAQAQPPPKDHFNLQHHPQFTSHHHHPQFPPHFALQHHSQFPSHELNFRQPHPPLTAQPPPQLQPQLQQHHPHHRQHHHHQQQPQQLQQPQPVVSKTEVFTQNAATIATTEVPKESAPVGPKRRGGSGGLNKVCSVSPALQAIVGEPALPRTEIVKQLWAYIRKNSLQDPSNKRKIICDDALRVVFETDCTDMFKMNKLLAKHITPLDPSKESSQTRKGKVKVESTTEGVEPGPKPVIISEALAKFLGTGGREMLATEAENRVWEYIKVNHLEVCGLIRRIQWWYCVMPIFVNFLDAKAYRLKISDIYLLVLTGRTNSDDPFLFCTRFFCYVGSFCAFEFFRFESFKASLLVYGRNENVGWGL